MGRLTDKVAIVTGAGGGIGAATARLMAAEGAAVVVTDVNEQPGATVAAQIAGEHGRAVFCRADVGAVEDVERLVAMTVAEFGCLDIVHNNAAAVHLVERDVQVGDLDLEVWDATLRVNLTGAMLVSRAALPHMLARGGGAFVHTSSVVGLRSQEGNPAYAASKAGLIALSRSIALSYGKRGIRSNVIAPGMTLSEVSRAEIARTPEVERVWREHHMTPWLGAPEDQANAAVFLAGDEARFVTGQVLTVDGGLTAYLPQVPSLRRLASDA